MQLQIVLPAEWLITQFAPIRTFNPMPFCISFLSNWLYIHVTCIFFCICIIILWFMDVSDWLSGHNLCNFRNRNSLEKEGHNCLVTSYVGKYWANEKLCDVATKWCVNVSQPLKLKLKHTHTFCIHNYIKHFMRFSLEQKLAPEVGLWSVHWNNGKQNLKNWVFKRNKKNRKIRPSDLREFSESHNI